MLFSHSFLNPFQNLIFVLLSRVKAKLHEMMQTDKDFTNEDDESLNPCHKISISNALKVIGNPVQCCQKIYNLIQELNRTIEEKRKEFDDSCE